ncbi:MAG: zinc ribbon domain-containing protein [bacterium]|nr:zinc ribbon domain-containing protein [bacterium]
MFCPNCGKQIEDGTKFCAYCGKATGAAAPTGMRREGVPGPRASEGKGLITAGYVCSGLGIVLPPIAIAGVVIGFMLLNKGERNHGLNIIIMGLGCGIVGGIIGYYAYVGRQYYRYY